MYDWVDSFNNITSILYSNTCIHIVCVFCYVDRTHRFTHDNNLIYFHYIYQLKCRYICKSRLKCCARRVFVFSSLRSFQAKQNNVVQSKARSLNWKWQVAVAVREVDVQIAPRGRETLLLLSAQKQIKNILLRHIYILLAQRIYTLTTTHTYTCCV